MVSPHLTWFFRRSKTVTHTILNGTTFLLYQNTILLFLFLSHWLLLFNLLSKFLLYLFYISRWQSA